MNSTPEGASGLGETIDSPEPGGKRPTGASDAKRSRGRISLQFAICREIFRNCRESDPIAAKFSNGFKILEGRPPDQGAGKIFWYCREEQRGIANGGRVWRVWRAPGKRAERRAQIRRDYAWLGSRNQRIVTAAEERG